MTETFFHAAGMFYPYYTGTLLQPGEGYNQTNEPKWWLHNLDADTDMGDDFLDDLLQYGLDIKEVPRGSELHQRIAAKYGEL